MEEVEGVVEQMHPSEQEGVSTMQLPVLGRTELVVLDTKRMTPQC